MNNKKLLLSDEQVEDFFASLNKKYYKDEFYDIFINYLEDNNIFAVTPKEEDELEQAMFKIAKERGYIGYDVIYETDNLDRFKEILTKYTKKYGYYLFHFMYENPDEEDFSTTAVWDKWNQLPPQGWIGGWCSCGNFFPFTFDAGEMDLEQDKYTFRYHDNRAIKIELSDLINIKFCSDNYFRLYMKNNKVIMVRPYKIDTGLVYAFIENPLDILA
jgi:hypothetical protein